MPQMRSGIAWLELLFALAVTTLLLLLTPETGRAILWAIDLPNWPRSTWFGLNVAVLLVLVVVRFGPDLVKDWKQRRERHSLAQTKHEKDREIKEQREVLERLQEAKKRRLY